MQRPVSADLLVEWVFSNYFSALTPVVTDLSLGHYSYHMPDLILIEPLYIHTVNIIILPSIDPRRPPADLPMSI
jgi:hypothetical protein